MNYSRSRGTLLSLLAASLICPARVLPAPAPPRSERGQQASPGCDPTGALSIVEQQLSEAKTLDDVPARIKVLIRAADMLWATRPEAARSAFAEAYDLAAKNFKEKGDGADGEGGTGLLFFLPDQRFIVINAVSRRDAEWAKRLAERAAKESEEEAKESAAADPRQVGELRMGEKFLDAAFALAPLNRQAAVDFARRSFRYPASWNGLTTFLYRLAEVDQKTGDQFYLEALEFYSARPVNELLYLTAYPFGLNRFVGPDASAAYAAPPQGFVPSAQLQQRLIEVLLRRAQAAMQAPAKSSGAMNLPETAQLYLAFESLSPLVTQSALAERVAQEKVALGAAVPAGLRQRMTELGKEQREIDEPSFADLTRQAERETVPWKKEYLHVKAVMAGLESESLEHLEELAGEVGDENVRRQLLNWLYFRSAQKATAAGRLEDAARLARKVEEVDQRAYLFFEIASTAEKKFADQARFREALDEAAKVALDAPNTEQRARALLGVAHLYSKLDQFRAVEVMGDAVKTVNRLEHTNFMPTLIQQIKAEQFAVFLAYPLAGFDIETGFRDLAAADFQGALALARTLDNKALRAGVVMAIAARCLEKPARKKEAGGKGRKAAAASSSPAPPATP
jgi:hypothetical protein